MSNKRPGMPFPSERIVYTTAGPKCKVKNWAGGAQPFFFTLPDFEDEPEDRDDEELDRPEEEDRPEVPLEREGEDTERPEDDEPEERGALMDFPAEEPDDRGAL